nr:putative defensin-like protein 234 [Ipomoea batatas]GMD41266.1 putative defensin-like protein 234 [Ipomoea batatas]
MFVILSLAIFLTLLNPSLGELKFCPGTFTASGVCGSISCGNLALFHWPASEMPHSCRCAGAGAGQSLCTCQIVC